MKKILIIGWLLVVSRCCWAQYDVYSIGLRGSLSAYLSDGGLSSVPGPGLLLDLSYTHYWSTFQSDMGIKSGVSAGYTGCTMVGHLHETFVNYDYLSNEIDYTVTSTIRQSIKQVQVEIPLMFAYRRRFFVMNIGPKLLLNVHNQYSQTLQGTNIDAYYPTWKVHVVNELITGKADEVALQSSGTGFLPLINLLLGADFGYEWTFGRDGCVGLGAFLNISPWSNYRVSTSVRVIDVTPIYNEDNPPAIVKVSPLVQNSCHWMLYIDFGVRCYVGINHSCPYRYRRH